MTENINCCKRYKGYNVDKVKASIYRHGHLLVTDSLHVDAVEALSIHLNILIFGWG